jgi:RNA polymerase sigma-70 factor (ECF subfamily)
MGIRVQSDRRARPGRPVLPDLSAAVMLAQAGDEEAFRALYRAVQPGLVRYLRAIVGEDAEDVASETWSQIARDLGSFHGDGDGFRGWAATVARNQALDHLRYQRRRPATTTWEGLPERPASDDPEAAAVEIMSTQAAIAFIGTLPRDQAEAVLLRVVMGLDVETTGRVLGKSAGAVRVATHRGLRRLAERLDAARGGDSDRSVPADGVTGVAHVRP